ncbi:NupC/NupG family nucleoside CNT transporter [Piscicoccus intestinalis]|uniref:NupC/NupG family nucleoside CNT transporter n=1 Tax=Piscicoccus intestinalis TaxID=746033 RepID=UPI000A7E0927|nr:nucleoside transporter C-terminal domain-containing protein [Piscicoccus intestinalis]
MDILWAIAGMVGLVVIAVLFSSNRRAIKPRTVIAAFALQLGFGVLVLYVPWGRTALTAASAGVQAVIDSSRAGIEFLFGPLLPENGTIFAFQVLPVIVFFASLTAVLYYLGWLQWVVEILGGGLAKMLGTERAESVNAAANIFVGQTEAPLVIRPYLKTLTRSGLFAVMVGGLSTVAGSVLVGYSLLGANLDYLIAASFMAAPGALLMAKLIVPEDGRFSSDAEVEAKPVEAREAGHADDEEAVEETKPRNLIDAAAAGASDGLSLALNIGAMLLAFISLIALLNMFLGLIGGIFGHGELTFQILLGWLFAPVMTMIGVPWGEAVNAGSFVGQKIVLNEFVAFSQFGPIADTFTPKTAGIVTFALTGFANLGSLGILLGGLGGLAPNRRSEIAHLGLRAILAGTLANLMSAAIAGMLL